MMKILNTELEKWQLVWNASQALTGEKNCSGQRIDLEQEKRIV